MSDPMNVSTGMPVPPPLSPPPLNAPEPALGEHPDDRAPVSGLSGPVESILRQPRRILYHLRQPGAAGLAFKMLFFAAVAALVYGLVVGTFSMGVQLWAAPVKVAGGLLISALICLPSLYIFACLGGAEVRLTEVVGLVCGMLLLTTLLLIGFAPVAWLFSQSTESLVGMGALHLAFWLIAAIFGLRFLRNGFSYARARSHAGLYTWMIIFMLVALQMTTALRPIVGTSDTFLPQEKKTFLAHWADCLKEAARSPDRPPRGL